GEPLSLAEAGGVQTFTYTLSTQPRHSADVSFSVAVSDPAQCALSASTVTIPNAAWETGAQVTVTAIDDAFDDGDLPCHLLTGDPASSDPAYDALTAADTPDNVITILDADTAGVSPSPTGPLSLAESGGSETVTFTLDAQP